MSEQTDKTLKSIFKYSQEGADINRSSMGRKQKAQAKADIVRKFWEENRDNPVVLDMVKKLDKLIEYHIKQKPNGMLNFDKYRATAYSRVVNELPFYDPNDFEVITYFDKRIKGALYDSDRNEIADEGITRNVLSVLKAIPVIEQQLGEEFSFSRKDHVQHLRDMGFSDKMIERAEHVPETLSLDTGDSEYALSETLTDSTIANPEEYFSVYNFCERIENVVSSLNTALPNKKNHDYVKIFKMVNMQGKDHKTIADMIGVSLPCVSQIMTKLNKYVTKELGLPPTYFDRCKKRSISPKATQEHEDLSL